MVKYLFFSGALIFLSLFSNAQTIYPDYIDGQLYVVFKPGIDLAQQQQFTSNFSRRKSGTTFTRPFAGIDNEMLDRTWVLRFTDIHQSDILSTELSENPAVELVEKCPLNTVNHTPNDPSYTSQWYLKTIQADSAWDLCNGNTKVVVAVVDNAFRISHEDLKDKLWTNTGEIPNNNIDDDNNGYIDDVHGFDVAEMDGNVNPPQVPTLVHVFNHGTHCAGIAGADRDNNKGIASLGAGVKLMLIKAAPNSNGLNINFGYEGVAYAIKNNARIISLSFGGFGVSAVNAQVIKTAIDKGILVIAAAGNSNTNYRFYPAAYLNVLAVASTDINDRKSNFSNYGTWIDISAPGSSILSSVALNDASYTNQDGTSMAAPLVASLAAYIMSCKPNLTAAEVDTIIRITADDISEKNKSYPGTLGRGRINAFNAMKYLFPPQPDDVPEDAVSFFPNPGTNEIYVNTPQNNVEYTLSIVNTLGQIVREVNWLSNGSTTVSIDDLNPALYIIRISKGDTEVLLKEKFVKL